MTTPFFGLTEIAEGVTNQATGHNTALRQLEARGFRVLSRVTTTPAVGAAESDSYIIPAGATGVWSGKTNQMACWIGGAWSYYTPAEGVGGIWVNDEDTAYSFDGAAWVASGGVGATAPFSDATSIIKGSSDTTKQARFEVDGFTTATTRTITLPNKSGTMAMTDDAQPFTIAAFYPGIPTASVLTALLAAPSGVTTITFAAAMAGSSGKALTAATAQTDFDVRKNATTSANGTSVGTIRFAAAGTVPTFIAASGFTLTGGTDYLTVWAPATPDATLANIGISLYATR